MIVHGLALCAGIGGLELGVARAIGGCYRCVGYVERDAYAASTLVARMADAALDRAPIFDDLESFPCELFRGRVDLVTAGFPCQPFSVAGAQRGLEDERWLWPLVFRIVRDVGARFVFLENVPPIVAHGLGAILGDLASLGFDAEWSSLRASDVGAPHRRERLFVLAVADRDGAGLTRLGLGSVLDREREASRGDVDGCSGEDMGNAHGARLEGRRESERGCTDERPPWPPGPEDALGWERWRAAGGPEPALCRSPSRLPNRMDGDLNAEADREAALANRADRLRCLGNAVVPAQAELAFRELLERAMNQATVELWAVGTRIEGTDV